MTSLAHDAARLAPLLATDVDERLDALSALEDRDDDDDRSDNGKLVASHPADPYAVREMLLSDEDATARAAAAAFLERNGAASSVVARALIDALYDTHPSVRLAACRALARLRVCDGLHVLRRLALEEPIWWVRRGAVLAVARLDRLEAIPVLRDVLDDPFWRVRHAAIRALLALGADPKSSPELRAAILSNIDGSERAQGALRYLTRRLGTDAVRELDAATTTIMATASQTSAPQEGKIADPDPAVIAARLELGHEATAAELALYLGDPHEALRRAASTRLRELGDVRAIFTASLWLEEPRIPHATATVVALLDSLGPDIDTVLDASFADIDARPGLATWGLSYIASSGRWDRLTAITAAMSAKTPLVRRAATSALGTFIASYEGKHHDEHAAMVDRIHVAMDDADEDVRRIAVHALVQTGGGCWDAVLALPFARQTVLVKRLMALVALDAEDADVLKIAAGDSDPETRARAWTGLYGLGLLEASEIEAARAHADPWMRGAVLDPKSALDVLRTDADPSLKRAAFDAATSTKANLEASRIAMNDPDPWLRVRAAERLVRSCSRPNSVEEGEEDLIRVLRLSRDPDIAVRAAAADVLTFARDLPERLTRIREVTDDAIVRNAADTWLGVRATELMAAAMGSPRATAPKEPKQAPEMRIVNARPLGRTTMMVSPLVVSGAYEPSIASLFRAMNAGCNTFFWEPRYRNLTTFLKAAGERGQRPLIVAGTYHATERALREDVERALRRLRRDYLDVFLVFWTRSPSRLVGEVPRALERLKREGLVRAVGYSTHDRALAERTMHDPWDVVMVRHSAAHPGAEERLFARAEEAGVGVLGFSATSYSRLMRRFDVTTGSAPTDTKSKPALPTAVECYRYTLSQRGVTACLSAPRGGRELVENLAVLEQTTLDAARLEELRAHGRTIRAESTDFNQYIRRYPTMPDTMASTLDSELEIDAELASDVGIATDVSLS